MENSELLSSLGEQCGDVSLQCSDIAGYLNQLNLSIQDDTRQLTALNGHMASLATSQTENAAAARNLIETATHVEQIIHQSHGSAQTSLHHVSELIERVTGLESRLRAFLPIIETVGGISEELRDIAKKTRMLGFNAAIEATRGGEGARSFGVVAEEIRRLAERSESSARSASEKLEELNDRARALILGVEENIVHGRATGEHIDELRVHMDQVENLVEVFRGSSAAISRSTARATGDVGELEGGLSHFSASSREHARELELVMERVERLESFANDMFNSTAHAGLNSRNSHFVEFGMAGARDVAGVIGEALSSGKLHLDDLFDTEYRPIEGTDPVQYLNRFVPFADRHIRPLLDRHTAREPSIVGCCLVDACGFLPTHISAKSLPQRQGSRQWNLENARNRQIFMDSQTRRALDQDSDFFLYSYRQDLGEGRYRALRSVLVPLHFGGRRWGLYELGYLL